MHAMMQPCRCWPLSFHYFFYFSLLGTILPYLGLYLSGLAFTPVQIGELLAIFMLTKVIAPNVWGVLADRSGQPIFWVRIATFTALVLSIGLIVFQTFWALFWVLLLFSFFWHASLPQFESYTFKQLGAAKHRYGQIRLWGSIGFIAAVVAFGSLFENFGIALLPWILSGLLLIVWGSTYLVQEQRVHAEPTPLNDRFLALVRRPEVLGLLLVSFLLQASHGVYYSFFTIQMTELGLNKTLIAWLWALGVIAEIAVFWWMASLFQRFKVRQLILLAIILTIIRWSLTGQLDHYLGWIVVAQLLHAASFGLFHAGAIYLIDQYFTGSHHGKGQALFAASSHGLGGAVGMLIAGYAWQAGGAPLSYGLMSGFALLALLIAWRWVK
ncbi:MFS metabolite transporter [Thiosulfatimonas sediminis]|uniref:MFS metabolite transporter n=1 Tax=Thiosulfatimonas sediminis TaxID=2675054 RepID=A0A6F8PWN8_9GAMM|nr:MFS transporter [Thiosulfatimonas sediminis]BBP46424.1 MFS metabolite transporter [Thiosulfatimonas sediminis]